MTILNIIYAPNPIFYNKAKKVDEVNDHVRQVANDMVDTMYFEGAVGLGANMVGVDLAIIVLDLREQEEHKPIIMINPEIIDSSDEIVEFEEASLSFPGISAFINRPNSVKVKYLDMEDKEQIMDAEGFLARVIQHEIDYLHGKTFLDYLSKLKKDMLIKKMQKFVKHHPPHVHGEHCNH
jgi:peptide deformylase